MGFHTQVHFYGAHGPTHLFVLLHGFSGNPSHVEALGEAIARRFGSSALLMRPSCNQNTASLDGIDQCARRVLRELRRLVADTASLRTLSLVGYSMGGLVARYLSGALLLEELPFLGLSPLNLVTFATPHLGAERSGNGPMRFYLDHLGGRSLAQMNLSDETKLLALMAHPRSAFFRGLAARRLCQRPDGPLCRLPLGLHRTVGGWRIRTSSGWGGAQAVPARRGQQTVQIRPRGHGAAQLRRADAAGQSSGLPSLQSRRRDPTPQSHALSRARSPARSLARNFARTLAWKLTRGCR